MRESTCKPEYRLILTPEIFDWGIKQGDIVVHGGKWKFFGAEVVVDNSVLEPKPWTLLDAFIELINDIKQSIRG